MRKIKVLRIITRLNIGGPARHVTILSGGLESERYDSLLAYGSLEAGEGDMSHLAKGYDGIKSIFVPELVRKIDPLMDIKAFIKLFSLIKKEKPHIVHTHTAKAGALGRLAAILAGVPIRVHTFHGHVFYGYFGRVKGWIFLWIERFLAFFTDRIIAISEKQKEEISTAYGIGDKARYTVIRLGFELEQFLHAEEKKGKFRAECKFKEDNILIGIVGRLVAVKNHKMLLRVADRLRKDLSSELFNRIRFITVGDGPEKNPLIDYARSLGIESSVVFNGWAKNMDEVYADLDIVALTSLNEGTPLSLIEAAASSKPVITTNVGGVSDAVSGTDFLVEKDDDAAFALKLSELVKSRSKREEVGARGREYVTGKFSKENLIRETEKLYEKLLHEKGIPS
ncbi:MAG: glycosyltransferase family 4 protein [Omnitrophica bacterium]|nr:glycosyltransferase family 4 protein [Candidatus Omnitrophota bacterium]